jgi:hypothetical protein
MEMDAMKATVARHEEEEAQRLASAKTSKEQTAGPCDYVTFRYPASVETSKLSLVSDTMEIGGEGLTLKVSQREWTTTLLVPVGEHYFEFVVNGKEKKLSPLHEKESSWLGAKSRNKIRVNLDCESALNSYQRLPFPRPDFPLIKECLSLAVRCCIFDWFVDQASKGPIQKHSR